MTELLPFLREMTPGGYGIWTLVLMFLAWMAREWRETRKLSIDDRLARRAGYAKQVQDLQEENRKLRTDLERQRSEHEDYRRLCHAETDGLRRQIIELQNELEGFRRRLDSQAVALARLDQSGKAPHSVEAMGRVIRIQEGGK